MKALAAALVVFAAALVVFCSCTALFAALQVSAPIPRAVARGFGSMQHPPSRIYSGITHAAPQPPARSASARTARARKKSCSFARARAHIFAGGAGMLFDIVPCLCMPTASLSSRSAPRCRETERACQWASGARAALPCATRGVSFQGVQACCLTLCLASACPQHPFQAQRHLPAGKPIMLANRRLALMLLCLVLRDRYKTVGQWVAITQV